MDYLAEMHSNPKRFDLTVLILSLPNRLKNLSRIHQELENQSRNHSVQVIYLGDNKSWTVGTKRNHALTLVHGVYVTFIDDDDFILPGYVDKIMEAINEKPDLITFRVRKLLNSLHHKTHVYKLGYGRPHLNPKNRKELHANPDHLCVWERDKIQEIFPDKSLHEDHVWADKMAMHDYNVFDIDEELYIYDFNKQLSETQK